MAWIDVEKALRWDPETVGEVLIARYLGTTPQIEKYGPPAALHLGARDGVRYTTSDARIVTLVWRHWVQPGAWVRLTFCALRTVKHSRAVWKDYTLEVWVPDTSLEVPDAP